MPRLCRQTCWVIVACALVWVGHSGSAWAQDEFFRSSPGPLTRSHAELDTVRGCDKCHEGGRVIDSDKCLACHDHSDLKERIDAGVGYHASKLVKGRKCEACHLEHKGRGFDLMGWIAVGGMKSFDHKVTGWPLRGKHAATACEECHTARNKQGLRVFMGTDTSCKPCHTEDQPHGFQRDELLMCERCHQETAWKPPKGVLEFDHNDKRDAAMALVGSHAEVSCGKCHPKAKFNRFTKSPDHCGNCHDSPHDGHLFDKRNCDSCHSPQYRTLRTFRFDHKNSTRFDLAGSHSKLGCYDCHTKKLGFSKPDRNCEVCHADDNKHKNRFKQFGSPPKCRFCHPSSAWEPSAFDHDSRTKFALTAKHAVITCRKCHRGRDPAEFERFDPETVGCMGCHSHKNQHEGQYKDSECLRCHKEAGQVTLSIDSVKEVHGPKGRFPLVKGHKKVGCSKCHTDGTYEDTPKECGERCHEDSLHNGSLGDKCSRCHSPGTWPAVLFNHDEDTDYKHIGLHRSVPKCLDCHPQRKFDGTPRNCGASGCHKKDDAHQNALGNECERCHVETGEVIFNHNTMSRFPLTGRHVGVRCSGCHATVIFKPQPTDCYGCHDEPEIHKGKYGTQCENCHSTSGFDDIRALHDVGSFSLGGSHDRLPCERCHIDSRPLAGSGNLCINCHKQDDIHSNSLSPQCGTCHTQWSFAPARFDHSTVGCNLAGQHRTLACYDCHKTGNFGGLSAQCGGCHRDTALTVRAEGQRPDHAGFTTCAICHNPNTWVPGGAGVGTYARESVCR